jgi:hypothetical protein
VLQRALAPIDSAALGFAAVLARPLGAELGFVPAHLAAELRERILAAPGDAAQPAILAAVHHAAGDALGFVLERYTGGLHRHWAGDILAFAAFARRARAFIAAEPSADALSAAAPARPSTDLEELVTNAFAGELAAACGPAPRDFAAAALAPGTELGWFDAFVVYLAWELKSSDTLRVVLFSQPLRTARDLKVTSPELISRLYQHATYLSNRFERTAPAAGTEEEAWLAHETERQRRAAGWTPERRAQLDAAVAIVAPITAVTPEALTALAAEIPAGRIGTHLAAEQLEAQVEAMTRLPGRLMPLVRNNVPAPELEAAVTDLIARGSAAQLAGLLDIAGATFTGAIAAAGPDARDACLALAHQRAALAALEEVRLSYPRAARLYADAGHVAWPVDTDAGFAFLVAAARALEAHGRWSNDQPALKDALALLADLDLHHRQQDAAVRAEYTAVLARARLRLAVLAKDAPLARDGIALAGDLLAAGADALAHDSRRDLGAALVAAHVFLFHQATAVPELDRALAAADAALPFTAPDTGPASWAALHNVRTTVTLARARHETAPRSFDLAQSTLDGCAEALRVYTSEASPQRIAELEERAGDACVILCAQPGSDPVAWGERAQRHFAAAQTYFPVATHRPHWTRLQGKIGDVELRLARLADAPARIDAALAAYDSALAAAPRDKHAAEWAALQERLGDNAATLTGAHESRGLDIALAAYTAAAEAHLRKDAPAVWGRLQQRLGGVHQRRAKGEAALAEAAAARDAFRHALETVSRETEAKRWATLQHSIGTACLTLANGPDADAHLLAGIAAHRQSLSARSRETETELWLQLQQRVGSMELRLAKGAEKETRGIAAIAADEAGLAAADRARFSDRWAEFNEYLGDARAHLAKPDTLTPDLDAAIANYTASLDVRTFATAPAIFARLCMKIGNAHLRLATGTDTEVRRTNARASYTEAARAYTQKTHPQEWSRLQAALGRC